MNEILMLYLWTRLDAIQLFLVLSSTFGVVFCVVVFIFTANPPHKYGWISDKDFEQIKELRKKLSNYAKRIFLLIPVLIVVLVLLPTKKDSVIIAGGWLAKEVSQSEIAQTIGDKTYRLITGKLDEALAELENGVRK